MNKYGILGWPLERSYSPVIHTFLLKHVSIEGKYELIRMNEINNKNIDQINKSYSGYNITIPYKEKILEVCEEAHLDVHVKKIGSVNTVKNKDAITSLKKTYYYKINFIVLAGLSFNNAGYLAENFRGGFNAVPETQMKAARSLGMNLWQAYTRILVPQVLKIVYYPMTNQFVWAVLMSSLGMLVGFRELSGGTQFFASKTYRIFEYFAAAAIIYYLMVKLILFVSRVLATRLFRY